MNDVKLTAEDRENMATEMTDKVKRRRSGRGPSSRIDALLSAREPALKAKVEEWKVRYGEKKQPSARDWAIYETAFAEGWAAAVKVAAEAGYFKTTW